MKGNRSGRFKKLAGHHTTLTPASVALMDELSKSSAITRVAPGLIKSGLPSVNGQRRVRVIPTNGWILLKVRDNRSLQELRVFVGDPRVTLEAVKGAVKAIGMQVVTSD